MIRYDGIKISNHYKLYYNPQKKTKWMISDPKSLPKIGRSIDTATCSAQVNESVDCLERSSTGLSSPPNSVATELRSFFSNIWRFSWKSTNVDSEHRHQPLDLVIFWGGITMYNLYFVDNLRFLRMICLDDLQLRTLLVPKLQIRQVRFQNAAQLVVNWQKGLDPQLHHPSSIIQFYKIT